VGVFYVQEELVPGCPVDDVWLWVHCKKITIVFLELVWLGQTLYTGDHLPPGKSTQEKK
jgi:hypothetical protein